MLFSVTWEMDIEADSPREAARLAREIQLNPESEAVIFEVAPNKNAGPVRIGSPGGG